MRRRLVLSALLISPLALIAPLSAQTSSTDYTEPYQVQALDLYRTIIGFRTAEGHEMVPTMANYLADQFRAAGFPDEDIHVLPHVSDQGEPVASFVVRWRGDGSSGKEPVLFTGHMDVVDALPEDWERNPFSLTEEDGMFFARGTADDKVGVAHLVSTFLRLKAEGFVPTRDMIIGFTGDEETGMVTTKALVDEHIDLTRAEFALNADAGGGALSDEDGSILYYEVQTAEKTYATYELTVTNPGGHSSRPTATNAIYELSDALRSIQAHRFPVMVNAATRLFFERASEFEPGEVGAAMRALAANPNDAEAAEVLWNVPGFVGTTRTTCVATMLRAGHAENALPQSATATVNCRLFPGVTVDEIEAKLQELAGPGVGIVVLDDPTPSAASPLRDDVISAVEAGLGVTYPGTTIIPYMSSGGTDGMHFRAAGIPTYGITGVFMKGSDGFAHGLNERIPVASFFDGLEFWKAVIHEVAGRPSA
jgi:carboxypeptidase PM20D1